MPPDELRDIGGGVSVYVPADAPAIVSDDDDKAARSQAFLQLSEEIARVSSEDPLVVSPLEAEPDPNLEFFMKNKPE